MNAFAADNQTADGHPDSQAIQAADDEEGLAKQVGTVEWVPAMQASIGQGSQAMQAAALQEGLDQLLALAGILGLDLLEGGAQGEDGGELAQALEAILASLGEPVDGGKTAEEDMDALLALRQAYRKAKNFAGADKIRDELHGLSIVVEDTPQGPRWHRA
jgi:cysteinyl-tRNA synthetase